MIKKKRIRKNKRLLNKKMIWKILIYQMLIFKLIKIIIMIQYWIKTHFLKVNKKKNIKIYSLNKNMLKLK